jgi:protein O-GlcNAc transferase
MLNYFTDLSNEDSLIKHKKWERDYWKHNSGKAFVHKKRHSNKKLKVGYVSGDFRTHSVAYFFEPLLKAHNRSNLEIFCYYNHSQNDETNKRLQSLSDHWYNIEALNDEDAAKKIKQDGIDILIDLSGHSAYNRLGVFARKPAPIQATWLGYPNSTGVSTIDYRITDAITDPELKGKKHCSEKIIRLDQCFLCYQGPEFPESKKPPSLSNGYITFGSFNNLSKINKTVIEAWANILKGVPESKLVLKSQQFKFPEVREILSKSFALKGINGNRIELKSHTATTEDHLNLYKEIDIALDTFPYNGTTTTCEALWMGVPVITLLGDRHISRVSASILTHAGLENLIADDKDNYIDLAISLAESSSQLIELRAGLRNQLKESQLTNSKLFAMSIERAFENMLGRKPT